MCPVCLERRVMTTPTTPSGSLLKKHGTSLVDKQFCGKSWRTCPKSYDSRPWRQCEAVAWLTKFHFCYILITANVNSWMYNVPDFWHRLRDGEINENQNRLPWVDICSAQSEHYERQVRQGNEQIISKPPPTVHLHRSWERPVVNLPPNRCFVLRNCTLRLIARVFPPGIRGLRAPLMMPYL